MCLCAIKNTMNSQKWTHPTQTPKHTQMENNLINKNTRATKLNAHESNVKISQAFGLMFLYSPTCRTLKLLL